jgi:hypothetical protein
MQDLRLLVNPCLLFDLDSSRFMGLAKQVVAELKRLGIQVDSRVFMISRSGVS